MRINNNLAGKFSLSLFILVCFLQNYASAQSSAAIVPGEGVGLWKLDSTRDGVKTHIPINMEPRKARTSDGFAADFYSELGLTFYFNAQDKVEKILVINQNFIVRGSGIHVGDNYSKVKEKYGNLSADLQKLGIYFHKDPNSNKIAAILITKGQ